MSDAVEPVPRSTGEIISDAVAGLRRAFPVVFTLAVPFCAVDLFLREVAQSFQHQFTAKVDPAHVDVDALAQAWPNALAAFGFLFASFFAQSLLGGAVVAVGDDLCWGRTPTVKRALSKLAERGAPLLLTSILFLLLLVLAMFAAMMIPTVAAVGLAVALDAIPLSALGVFLGAGLALIVTVVLTLRWSLYAPAVVVEGKSLFSALGRSTALTAARGLPFFETPKFRLSVLLLVGLALSGVLQSLFLAPRLILAVVTGWSFANFSIPGLSQMPVWFMLPFGLMEIVTNAIVMPFSGLLLCFFAFDLRVRYEGVQQAEQQ